MANLDYIIDEVEKLKEKEKKLENEAIQAAETEKKLKSLEKHLDPEKNWKMEKKKTEYIDSHPDSWKKKGGSRGFIETDEGTKWGSLNKENKFIFDDDKEEVIENDSIIDDKDEVIVDDKDKVVDDKIEINGGEALNTIIKNDLKNNDGDGDEKEKTGFAKFTQTVGKAFEHIATGLPKKMEEVWADKDRKRNFLRGLYIINESSGITPLSQAKSPLGKISSGIIKAEKQFTAEDLAKYKAMNPMRRYKSHDEEAIIKSFEKWQGKFDTNKNAYEAVFAKYNLAKNIALKKGELPTGILNKTFRNIKAFLAEVPGGEELYNQLAATFADEDYIKKHGNKMGLDEQVIFNDLFQAATYAQVVKEVKELYPVSNKDIETLLKAKGDIGSKPEALRRLIAAQMATREIALGSEKFAYEFFRLEDPQFENNAVLASEKMIADKLRKENIVTDVTLKTLFGSKDDVTDAGYISAYYYQTMKVKEKDLIDDPYTIFVTAEKSKEKEIQRIIEENQKKKELP